MNDRELDRALQDSPAVERQLSDAIQRQILADVKPVRPLEPRWMLAAEVIAAAAAVAFAGAWRVGFLAIQRMAGGQAAAIFAATAILFVLAAGAATAAMIPGARLWVRPSTLTALGAMSLAAIFGLVFPDYSMAGFVPQGIPCLRAGLMDALPAGLVAWLVMRRGFAAGGAATGLVAGLAGLLMLELHCPIFEAPHAMVWHVGVVPIGTALGAAVGRWLR